MADELMHKIRAKNDVRFCTSKGKATEKKSSVVALMSTSRISLGFNFAICKIIISRAT
jgi:hypothetical protein